MPSTPSPQEDADPLNNPCTYQIGKREMKEERRGEGNGMEATKEDSIDESQR